MSKPLIFCYYLPQFHKVKENDEWWGEGFTEWVHVKKAKPLFDNHYQPVVPLEDNYYDLENKETVIWQTNLMKKYGVDGMAYYHYWFNGDLLLEKPAENLLKWKDIDQKFIFVWANHSWYKNDNGHKIILKEQTYGDESDWKRHYRYLVEFFKDDRYIKVNNCPALEIYKPFDIYNYKEMLEYWDSLAKEDGFSGIYVINNISKISEKTKDLPGDAVVFRQPDIAMSEYRNKHFIRRIIHGVAKKIGIKSVEKIRYNNYSEIERNIENKMIDNTNISSCFCVACGWDNTPRHKYLGKVLSQFDPIIFEKNLYALYELSVRKHSVFLFINAWNEWAEGMMMEPTEKYEYQLLEKVKKVVDENNR